jgi:hypothetical protein
VLFPAKPELDKTRQSVLVYNSAHKSVAITSRLIGLMDSIDLKSHGYMHDWRAIRFGMKDLRLIKIKSIRGFNCSGSSISLHIFAINLLETGLGVCICFLPVIYFRRRLDGSLLIRRRLIAVL